MFNIYKIKKAAFFVSLILLQKSFAQSNVPFSELKIQVGKIKRIPTSKTATFTMPKNMFAQLEQDPLTNGLLLHGLSPGKTWLTVQNFSGTPPQKIEISVVAAKNKKEKKNPLKEKPELWRSFRIPGWN